MLVSFAEVAVARENGTRVLKNCVRLNCATASEARYRQFGGYTYHAETRKPAHGGPPCQAMEK